jgi:thiol-disulfide isomerase/thioredoxin
MKLNILFGVLVILIALLVALRYRTAAFEGFAADGTEVIIAKASWCGHCKAAMPEFEKLVASPIALKDGSKATVTMLDDAADKEKIAGLGVKGYPTILVMHKGERLEYPGDRTAAAVTEFVQNL